jgi:Zn-dependent protease/predicted transcriptional regulator
VEATRPVADSAAHSASRRSIAAERRLRRAAAAAVRHGDGMRGSWTIARVGGVAIRVHVTFLLLLLWFGIVAGLQAQSWGGAVRGVLFVCIIFACVVLHELGHAFVARRYGIGTRDITLLPIGGMARLTDMPREPRAEIAIALAGPAVNFAIALGLWLALPGEDVAARLRSAATGGDVPLVISVLLVNLSLGTFNLLPAFPMDGGRVLRALLALRLSALRATRIAARVGQAIAAAFVVLGLLGNPLLALIGVFIWFGAALEAAEAQVRDMLEGMPIDAALITEFSVLSTDDTLDTAATLTVRSTQADFPVLRAGVPVGVLTQRALLDGLRLRGGSAPVGDVMLRELPLVGRAEHLDAVWRRLQTGQQLVGVQEDGRLIGLIDAENLMELSRILAARRGVPESPGA